MDLQRELSKIVGLPLSDIWRALGQVFEFGEQRPFVNKKGDPATRSDFSVKFLDVWRVTRGPAIVFGSGDHRGKRRFYDRKTPPQDPTQRERWERAKEFIRRIEAEDLLVERVMVTDSFVVVISLSDGYEIAGFGASSESAEFLFWSDDTTDTYELV